ncbi:SusC/RagA family TonB-linked outer membrane protein [Chitinophaga pinensis]|uniref:TonB-dependent receptor plug n=1 Tax=Chitinophaga pinensis (strain ATCC 43595 / DSM 2588 / LMG 13176 / NBRC 15968 / NCIMB 11800 / UQM 2034) TaxID=485918 RepID=A0A979FYV0_CHIPD|nr:SusC/RagA family TonB-linked outer membrane protein [Chitinophaga pinensis]ACU57639.1 TonB-dependent receptor plug [Chitinophaga pinensis DSM 2588]
MQKIVKLNRVVLYCCMVVLFCLQHRVYAAPTQGKPVSLTIKNSSLAEVLRQVSKKSGLYIYFQDADLAGHRNVSLDAKNKPVESVLHELLDERGFSWVEVSENTIAVKKKLEREEGKVEMDTVSTITVTGKVVDEKGEPVIGATVVVKGGKVGTTTNVRGIFELKGVKTNSSLVISNLSFLSKEVAVKGRLVIGEVQLKEYVGVLDETVVIAYGTTTKRFNTGNVASVSAAEIERQPVNNPLYALQGRVAGLQVTPTTGLGSGAVSIQIRGRNSLSFQSDPLVVVDGLPVANNITGLGHGSLLQISALSFINPNDIESIEVLKDADATSIYGSRGANGVILITTKKGKVDDVRIDINIRNGWSDVPRRMKMLNTTQYLDLRKEAYANSGIDISSLELSRSNVDVKYWDKDRYTDWQKVLIGNHAKYNDIQGTLSGGSTQVQYTLGGNYHNETTVFSKNDYDRKGSAHMSISGTTTNQKFKGIVSASYLIDNNRLPMTDFTRSALTLSPNAPSLYTSEGALNWGPMPNGSRSWENPYGELFKSYEARLSNLISSATFSYSFSDAFTAKIQMGYNELRGNSFRKTYPFAGRAPEFLNEPGNASFNASNMKNLSFEPQLNYKFNLKKIDFDILFGGSIQNTTKEEQFIFAQGATNDALLKNLAAATYYYLNNNSSQYKYAAAFARIGFNWDKKYILNLSARRDGSSRFGPNNQFGNFGSIGAAWLFGQEDFSKIVFPFLSFGKIRFSYGTSGNDGIGDYQYLERYDPIDVSDPYQGVRGYRTRGLFNPYYAWEVTKKMELGLEIGVLKDRLFLTTSFFRNRSNNQLQNYPFSSIVGPGGPLYNIGALVQNQGIEVLINSENIKNKKFKWSTSFNISKNRNKLLSYPDIENSAYYQSIIGQPFYGEVRAYNSTGVDPATGKYSFLSVDGKIVSDPIDPNRQDYGQYLRILTTPKFFGGMGNTLSWGNFTLDIYLQFTKQNGMNPMMDFIFLAGSQNNLPVEFLNRWQKSGDKSDFQKVYNVRPDDYNTALDRVAGSNYSYTDASFIRLKNMSLSYSMSNDLVKKIRLKDLRLYFQTQNLFTITGYKGLDPETQTIGSLPPLRTMTVGVQVGL